MVNEDKRFTELKGAMDSLNYFKENTGVDHIIYRNWIGDSEKRALIFNSFDALFDICHKTSPYSKSHEELIEIMDKYANLDEKSYQRLSQFNDGNYSLLTQLGFSRETKIQTAQELIKIIPDLAPPNNTYESFDLLVSKLEEEYVLEYQ